MTFRSAPWRRSCPELVSGTIDEALRATIYIVHQAGPTGFVLKQEGESKKVKVLLGDLHNCSCAAFRKKREVCLHILWILLKKFRIPRENPIIWQLGLIEREISEILLGHLRKQSPVHSSSKTGEQAIIQRDIRPDDVCPICQDDLLSDTQKTLTYCKYGCGKSVHLKCMKIWADHQRSTGESIIRCPLCRENFGAISEIPSKSPRRVRAEKAFLHLGMACTHCHVCPIAGKCYRCCQCASYYLCHACFSSNQVHLLHSFEVRQHCNQPWREAERPTRASLSAIPPSDSPALPPALINSLQSRSLTENDYELLLQLDNSNSASTLPNEEGSESARHRQIGSRHQGRQSVPERVINSFHVEPLDGNHPLITGGDSCQVCYSTYSRGDWIRKLPCKHKFHRECIDEWLRSSHTSCPIDGLPVYDPTNERRLLSLRSRKSRRSTAHRHRSRQLAPLSQHSRQESSSGVGARTDEQMEFTISGQSIIGDKRQSVSKKSARRKRTSTLRQRTVSHSPSKTLSNHSADISATLPKIEQRRVREPSTHTVRMRPVEEISLPEINPSTDGVTLIRSVHEGYTATHPHVANSMRRLTIEIPSASGDGNTATTRDSLIEKHSKSASKMPSTAASMSVRTRSKNHSLPAENGTQLAPTCSSYNSSLSGPSIPIPNNTSRKSVERVSANDMEIEAATSVRLIKAEGIHSNTKTDNNGHGGGEEETKQQLAVLPAISNLSASSPRFTEVKLTNSMSPVTSMFASRKLKRGSVVMGEKSAKRSISLRESASNLLDTSLQVSSYKLVHSQEHKSTVCTTVHAPSIGTYTTIT